MTVACDPPPYVYKKDHLDYVFGGVSIANEHTSFSRVLELTNEITSEIVCSISQAYEIKTRVKRAAHEISIHLSPLGVEIEQNPADYPLRYAKNYRLIRQYCVNIVHRSNLHSGVFHKKSLFDFDEKIFYVLQLEEEMNELNIASFLSSVQIAIMRAQGLHFQVDSIIAENVLEIRGHLKLQSATGSYV